MHVSEQFALDLEGNDLETRLHGQWALNQERDARNWTVEAHTMVWVLGGDDWDWWNSFPRYQRAQWISWYEDAQSARRGRGTCDMQTFVQYQAGAEDRYQRNLELATAWSKQIREAWLNRKPCPIIPAPGFEHILHWAFDLA